MKKVLFYSSINDIELFNIQGFYGNDINCLKAGGYQVKVTNRCSDFLRFWSYDSSFLYFYRKSLAPAIISKVFQKKVVFTGGVDDLSITPKCFKYKVQKILINLCYYFANSFLVVSDSDMSNIRKALFSSDAKKLLLSYHSIDILNSYNPYDKSSFQDRKICSTICWMGSVQNVKRKGVDKSLHLFKRLGVQFNKFYIIGKIGPGTSYLKKVVSKLGLDDLVVFTGDISNAERDKILVESRLYFQCSSYEGFGVAALEALYHGCCVIHSGKGGLSSTISSYGVKINLQDCSKEDVNVIDILNFDHDINYVNSKKHLLENFSHHERMRLINKGFE